MTRMKRITALLLALFLLSSCAAEKSAETGETTAADTEITEPAPSPSAETPETAPETEETVPEEIPLSSRNPEAAAENLARAVEYGKNIREKYWDSETGLSTLTPDGGTPHLWPFTEQVAMVNGILLAMAKSHEDRAYFEEYLTELLEGLRYYRIREARMSDGEHWNNEDHIMAAFGETDGTGNCYAIYSSSRNNMAIDRIRALTDAVYFDDNVWVAKEMYYAYVNLGDVRYLNEAINILNWIIGEGFESTEGLNGIYWKWSSKFQFAGGDYNDSNHASLNACSTVPTAMMLAKVYQLTESMEEFAGLRENYLNKAEAIFRFSADVLLDSSSGCIMDKIFLKQGFETMTGSARIHKTDGSRYAYNTGTFMTAAAELYTIAQADGRTDDAEFYRSLGERTAKSADREFADRTVQPGQYSYPSHSWFTSFLLEGFCDLTSCGIDASEYIGHMHSALDYAWLNHRAEDGLVSPSWIKGWSRFNNNDANSEDNPRQILLQSANAHCYAMLSRYLNGTAP